MINSKPNVYVIAEAGVNHNGSLDLAFKLIDAAASAGADAVKFQTFKTDKLVTKNATKAEYQIKTTNNKESAYEMLKSLELTESDFEQLAKYANELNIDFLSTAFDKDSLLFLVHQLHLKTLKIPSGEITNAPLVLACARSKCNLILSTGMATMDEIEEALGVIAYGFIEDEINKIPTIKDFKQAYASKQATKLLNEKVTILHCTTEYPAPIEEINLSAMNTMKDRFRLNIGYSDHTKGVEIAPIAVALGAQIIEKHFTLDVNMDGPDHKASLEPDELKNMICLIRNAEKSLGSGIKIPSLSETNNINIARKSLCAEYKISKGDIFSEENMSIKRPGGGISPFKYWEFIGKKSKNNYEIGDLINE